MVLKKCEPFTTVTSLDSTLAAMVDAHLLISACAAVNTKACGGAHWVNTDLYGDSNTRLFTYWTSDAYETTGCYNLLRSDFIEINSEIQWA